MTRLPRAPVGLYLRNFPPQLSRTLGILNFSNSFELRFFFSNLHFSPLFPHNTRSGRKGDVSAKKNLLSSFSFFETRRFFPRQRQTKIRRHFFFFLFPHTERGAKGCVEVNDPILFLFLFFKRGSRKSAASEHAASTPKPVRSFKI